MLLSHANLYTKDFRFAPESSVKVDGARIASVVEGGSSEVGSEEVVDLKGLSLIPGLAI